MKSMLAQLAEMTDNMVAVDLATAPNFLCTQAIIDALVDREQFNPTFARKIAFRMKIDVSTFDITDNNWRRIIDNYATLIGKIYDQVTDTDTMLEVAKTLELKYTV